MDTWLARMCRRSALRQVQVWSLILVAGILMVLLSQPYLTDFWEGPHAETAESLGKISNADSAPHYFVRVSGNRLVDTGIRQIRIEQTDQHVSAEYYALLLGKRILIVKYSSKPSLAVEGTIQEIPPELYSDLFSGLRARGEAERVRKLKMALYPFYLTQESTQGFRTPGYIAIGLALVLLLLLYKFARPAWARLKDVSLDPGYRRACAWGDPTSISAEIENEFDNRVRFKCAGIRLTDNYIIQKSWRSFNVLRMEDVLWAYEKVTKLRVEFIPVGKSYHAVLACYGGTVTIPSSKKRVEKILSYVAQRVPWAIWGDKEEWREMFSSRTKEFCAMVQERRRNYHKRA